MRRSLTSFEINTLRGPDSTKIPTWMSRSLGCYLCDVLDNASADFSFERAQDESFKAHVENGFAGAIADLAVADVLDAGGVRVGEWVAGGRPT